jgi:hypothetical protein
LQVQLGMQIGHSNLRKRCQRSDDKKTVAPQKKTGWKPPHHQQENMFGFGSGEGKKRVRHLIIAVNRNQKTAKHQQTSIC